LGKSSSTSNAIKLLVIVHDKLLERLSQTKKLLFGAELFPRRELTFACALPKQHYYMKQAAAFEKLFEHWFQIKITVSISLLGLAL